MWKKSFVLRIKEHGVLRKRLQLPPQRQLSVPAVPRLDSTGKSLQLKEKGPQQKRAYCTPASTAPPPALAVVVLWFIPGNAVKHATTCI